jgi:hypothetical protein
LATDATLLETTDSRSREVVALADDRDRVEERGEEEMEKVCQSCGVKDRQEASR